MKKTQLKTKHFMLLFIIALSFISYQHLVSSLKGNEQDYSKEPYYIDMMDDLSYNVYDVIQAGNTYFSNRDKGKGTGYKQFQHWIALNEDRFYPSGDRTTFNPQLPYEIREQNNHSVIKSPDSPEYNPITSTIMFTNQWEEVGPKVELKRYYDNVRNGNGRVDAIWVDPTNSNRIYVGCRGGGLWTTTDGGANWTVKTDDLGITGVNSIAVNSSNVNEIYIATALAGKRSLGVFKSTNAGDTWNATGVTYQLTGNITIHKILISPTNASVLFAGTSAGLLKSTDGFQTYSTVLTGSIIDVEFKPGDTTILYASNDTNNTIYKSSDSGASFTSTGLVGVAKPQIAVSANQSSYVYVSDKGVLYRSTDSGANFTLRAGNPDAGKGQYGGFVVSDTDADLVINGSLDTYRSTDGGASFTKVTDWRYNQSTGVGGNFVHADNREIEVINGTIYMGTDGWLVKSTDNGINYEVLTFNMGNHEIYEHGLGVSQSNANTLIVGTQDNGTSILRNGIWHHWKGGDGGTSMIDKDNADIMYGSLYHGNFKRTDNAGTTSNLIDLGDTKPGSVPPLVKHPTDAATIFMGEANGQVWKSTNRGGSWTTIGNLGGTDVLDELSVAPSNADYIYASIKNKIWRTTNGGTNWTELTGSLPNLVIKGIAIDYDDPNKVVICYTGYTAGDKTYRTTNGGTSWTNISGTLPNIPITDVVYDNNTDNALYISSDIGVYYRDDTLTDWTKFGTGLPNVRANDLEIQHSSSKLYVGTWGRGVWKVNLNEASTGSGDLQGYYKFNDNLNDNSSYNRHGSTTGTENYVSGYEGNAYSVSSTNTISINGYKGISGNNARSVTAWIKTPAVGTRKTIASWGINTSGQMFNVMVSNGNIRVEAGSSNVQNDDASVTLLNNDTWRHIAVTYDPADGDKLKDVKIYIDGVYYANQPDSGDSYNSETRVINTNADTNDLLIGTTFYNASYYWQGQLDEVKIYSKALTATEIANMAIKPTANFTSNATNISEGSSVSFTDTSTGNPTSWSWNFPGGTPSTSTTQNPTVTYNTSGTYNVTLTATNDAGNDVETKSAYIIVNTTSLEAEYPFDSDASDSSGNNYNGTNSGVTFPIDVIRGPVADFDGTDEIVVNGYNGIEGGNNRTITAWIKTTSTNDAIVSWGTTATSKKWIFMVDGSGRIRTEIAGGSIVGTTVINDGQWHHVACAFENDGTPNINELNIYIDGQQDTISTSSNTTLDTGSGTVKIGTDHASRKFLGQIDDLHIIDETWSASQILNDYNTSLPPTANFIANQTTIIKGNSISFTDTSTSNPTSWAWVFTGGTPTTSSSQNPTITYNTPGTYQVQLTASNSNGNGIEIKTGYITIEDNTLESEYPLDTDASDISGNGYNGTNNGVSFINDALRAQVADFDGSDEITVNGYAGIEGGADRTITAWVKTTTTNDAIVSWGTTATSKKWIFLVDNSGRIRAEIAGGYIVGNTSINDGQWHHVACSFENDGSPNINEVKIYIDGQPDTISTSNSKTINTGNGTVKIGTDHASRKFLGQIDDLHIIDEAWSASQVLNDYSSGSNNTSKTRLSNKAKINTSDINYAIFPNPFSDELTIKTQNNDISKITMFNIQGILVKTIYPKSKAKQMVINTTNISSGIYFLNITSKKKQVILKVIKQ